MLVQCSSNGGVRLASASGKLEASSFRISRTPSREWSSARTASSSARDSLTSRMKPRRVGDVFEIALLVAKQAVEMDLYKMEKCVLVPAPAVGSSCLVCACWKAARQNGAARMQRRLAVSAKGPFLDQTGTRAQPGNCAWGRIGDSHVVHGARNGSSSRLCLCTNIMDIQFTCAGPVKGRQEGKQNEITRVGY